MGEGVASMVGEVRVVGNSFSDYVHGGNLSMPNNTPREYTPEEVRDMLIKRIHTIVDYWANDSRTPGTKEKIEGAAFTILSLLDGCHLELPGFTVSPNPHPEDKQYHIERGENWFPENVSLGVLHEFFHNRG